MVSINSALSKAKDGHDLTPDEGQILLEATDPASIEAIRVTADLLRQQQSGDAVSYIVNRNINYTNICE